MLNKNSSAFPWESVEGGAGECGLTARQYIASQVLAGLAAGNNASSNSYLAARAVELADKLIVELNKPVLE